MSPRPRISAHDCHNGLSINETRLDLMVSMVVLLQPKNKMHLKLEHLVTGEERYPRGMQQETWGGEGRLYTHTQ